MATDCSQVPTIWTCSKFRATCRDFHLKNIKNAAVPTLYTPLEKQMAILSRKVYLAMEDDHRRYKKQVLNKKKFYSRLLKNTQHFRKYRSQFAIESLGIYTCDWDCNKISIEIATQVMCNKITVNLYNMFQAWYNKYLVSG